MKALIREGARTQFEKRLEEFRSELRQAEESFVSELRRYEEEVSTLRRGVLEGRAQRQAKVSARRIEALESLWLKFQRLGRMKFMAQTYSMLKIEKIESRIEHESNLQDFVKVVTGEGFEEILQESTASFERIFVSDIIWAIYSAYSAILFTVFTHMKALSLGLPDGSKLVAWDKVGELVKVIVPQQAAYIDKHGASGLPLLLEQIEQRMIEEVKAALNGEEDDQQALNQSSEIMRKIGEITVATGRSESLSVPDAADSPT